MIEIGNYRVKSVHNPVPITEVNALPALEHPLDSNETRLRFDKVRDWYSQAISSQYSNRFEMSKDHAYYDGEQWSEEDKRELELRTQAALVFNKIKPTVDWILGTERKSRVDTLVLARNKDKTPSAEAKTKLLKYIDDVNMTAYHRSHAFADAVISGVGWLEIGVRGDSSDEPLYVNHESWRNIWYDHLSSDISMKDARYLFRSKWVDLDIAQAMYPDRFYELESEAQHVLRLYPFNSEDSNALGVGSYDEVTGRSSYSGGSNYVDDCVSSGNRRLRVRLIECWYKETSRTEVCHCPDTPIHGAVLNSGDVHQQFAISNGTASTVDAIRPIVRLMVYCGKTVLFDDVSPYRHNRIPFIPIWCYRNGKDNAPYGIIRNLRDPQDDLNKRRSKVLHILNSNKVIVDANAATNWQEFYDEMQKSDGVIRVAAGSRITPLNDVQIAREQIELSREDAQFIQDVSGVTDENLGRDTRAESGVAIRSKQNQGLVATSVVFDNLNMAIQAQGEMQLSLVEQYYDFPKIIRLLNDKNAASYMEINQTFEDNITNDKSDFIVTQQDYRDTIRQSMFEMMTEFTTRLDPDLALNMLDLVVDMSDLPGREAIVNRIRKLNGQTDPDAAVTPEEEAQLALKEQESAAEQAMQKQMQQKMMELDLKLKESEAAKNEATLEKLKAEAVVKNIEALYSSMQAAQTVATVPGVVPIADEIAKSGGFIDKNLPPIYPEPVAPALAAQGVMSQPVQSNTSPMFPPRPATAGEGMMRGIETQENDGVIPI